MTYEYLENLGMKLEAVGKCSTVQFVPGNKTYYTQDPNIMIGTTKVQAVGPDEVIRYLGAKIKPWQGLVDSFELNAMVEILSRVKRLALKPMQKIELLRVYLMPKYMYGLICKPPHVVTLRAIDCLIRKEVKGFLRIHETVCNEMVYTPKRSGGLGLPEGERLCSSPRFGMA